MVDSAGVFKASKNYDHEFKTFLKIPNPTLADFSPVITAWEDYLAIIRETGEEYRSQFNRKKQELGKILLDIIQKSLDEVRRSGDDSTARTWLGYCRRIFGEKSIEVRELEKKIRKWKNYYELNLLYDQAGNIYNDVQDIISNEDVKKENYARITAAREDLSNLTIEFKKKRGHVNETDMQEVENWFNQITTWQNNVKSKYQEYESQIETMYTLGISGKLKLAIQQIEGTKGGDYTYLPNAAVTPGLNAKIDSLMQLTAITPEKIKEIKDLKDLRPDKIFLNTEATPMNRDKALAIAKRQYRIYSYIKYQLYFLGAMVDWNSGIKPYQIDPRKIKAELEAFTEGERGVLFIGQLTDADNYEVFFPKEPTGYDLPTGNEFIRRWGTLLGQISEGADEVERMEDQIAAISDVRKEDGLSILLHNYWQLKKQEEMAEGIGKFLQDNWKLALQDLKKTCIGSFVEEKDKLKVDLAIDFLGAKRKALFLLGLICKPPVDHDLEPEDLDEKAFQEEFDKQKKDLKILLEDACKIETCWDIYKTLDQSTKYNKDLKDLLEAVGKLKARLDSRQITSKTVKQKTLQQIEQTLGPIADQNLDNTFETAENLLKNPTKLAEENLGDYKDSLDTLTRMDANLRKMSTFPKKEAVLTRIQTLCKRLKYMVDYLEISATLENGEGYALDDVKKRLNAAKAESVLTKRIEKLFTDYKLPEQGTNDGILARLLDQVDHLASKDDTSFPIDSSLRRYEELKEFENKPTTTKMHERFLSSFEKLRENLSSVIEARLSAFSQECTNDDLEDFRRYLEWYNNENINPVQYTGFMEAYYEAEGLQQIQAQNWLSARAYFQKAESRPTAKAHQIACIKLISIMEADGGVVTTLHNQALSNEVLKHDPELNILNFKQRLKDTLDPFYTPIDLEKLADTNSISQLITEFKISVDGQKPDSNLRQELKDGKVDTSADVIGLFFRYWRTDYLPLIDKYPFTQTDLIPNSNQFRKQLYETKAICDHILTLKKQINTTAGLQSLWDGMKKLKDIRKSLTTGQELFDQIWNGYFLHVKTSLVPGEDNPPRIEDTSSVEEQYLKKWILQDSPWDESISTITSTYSQQLSSRLTSLTQYTSYIGAIPVNDNGAVTLRAHKSILDRLYEKIRSGHDILDEYRLRPDWDKKDPFLKTIEENTGDLKSLKENATTVITFLERVAEAVDRLHAALNSAISLKVEHSSRSPLGIDEIDSQWKAEKQAVEFNEFEDRNQWINHPGIDWFTRKVSVTKALRKFCEIGVKLVQSAFEFDASLVNVINPVIDTGNGVTVDLKSKIVQARDADLDVDMRGGNHQNIELVFSVELSRQARCSTPVHFVMSVIRILEEEDKDNFTSWQDKIHWVELKGFPNLKESLTVEKESIEYLNRIQKELDGLEKQRPQFDAELACKQAEFGQALKNFAVWRPTTDCPSIIPYSPRERGEYDTQAKIIRSQLDMKTESPDARADTLIGWKRKMEAVTIIPKDQTTPISNWMRNLQRDTRTQKEMMVNSVHPQADSTFQAITTKELAWNNSWWKVDGCAESLKDHRRKWFKRRNWLLEDRQLLKDLNNVITEALIVCPDNNEMQNYKKLYG